MDGLLRAGVKLESDSFDVRGFPVIGRIPFEGIGENVSRFVLGEFREAVRAASDRLQVARGQRRVARRDCSPNARWQDADRERGKEGRERLLERERDRLFVYLRPGNALEADCERGAVLR